MAVSLALADVYWWNERIPFDIECFAAAMQIEDRFVRFFPSQIILGRYLSESGLIILMDVWKYKISEVLQRDNYVILMEEKWNVIDE